MGFIYGLILLHLLKKVKRCVKLKALDFDIYGTVCQGIKTKGQEMILITGSCRGSLSAVRDIFLNIGIISEICTPSEAARRLSPRHNAVIAVGRDLTVSAGEITSEIRKNRQKIPIIALREDFFSSEAENFDAVYPNSLYCAAAHRRLIEIAGERGIRAVGEYSAEGLSVRAVRRAFFGDTEIPLTKAEVSVLSAVIAFYPERISAEKISVLSFRTGREPSPSGVRTHISAINKKLSAVSEASVIATGEGYTVGIKLPLSV